MSLVFAYECFGDEAVFRLLQDSSRRPLRGLHAYGQGAVVNALLVKRTAHIAMVDEDPMSTHHRLRDAMNVVERIEDFELRERDGRYLAVLRPNLEECFLRAAGILEVNTELPRVASDLRRLINRPNASARATFLENLRRLVSEARSRRLSNFLTGTIAALDKLQGGETTAGETK